jgi:hypothetical protein
MDPENRFDLGSLAVGLSILFSAANWQNSEEFEDVGFQKVEMKATEVA